MKFQQSFLRATALSIFFAAAGAAQQITISPATLPNGTVGALYQQDCSTGINAGFVWSIAQGSLPPGLTITNFSPGNGQVGRISGTPTTAGSYTFTVLAMNGPQVATRQYTVTIAPATIVSLATSPTSLTFNGVAGGELPPLQFPVITTTEVGPPVTFTVQIDDGAGGPQPAWIGSLASATTPSRLPVEVDPGSLQAGTYRARLRLRIGNGTPLDIAVTFNVTAASSKLEIFPRTLRFGGRTGTPGIQVQDILVTNVGGGAGISFSSTVVNNSSWLTLSPSSGTTRPNQPQILRVRANTGGLPAGGLRDTIRITSSAGTFDVTVTLFITVDGPILQVGNSGARFTVRQNNGIPIAQSVPILNVGTPGTTVNWTAKRTMATGQPDSTVVTTTSGRSTVGTPSAVVFTPEPNTVTLPVGAYYTLLTISDSNAINSPQFIVVVVEVADASTPPEPIVGPPSMLFTAVQDSTAQVPTQDASVSVNSTAGVIFNVGANTYDGGKWFNVTRTSALVSAANPSNFPVGVNPAGLIAGVYLGQIDVLIGTQARSITVFLIVLPRGATLATEPESAAALDGSREVTGCTASQIVIAPGVIANFSLPAAWPTSISARLVDNCGTALAGGNVVASFNNGDSPLTLADYSGTGSYLATWTPSFPAANVAVTFSASAGALPPNTYQVVGGVNANRFAPPQLSDGGTVNNTNPFGGALLAPGTVTAVYGQNLASSTVSPGVIPLVSTFNGSTLIMGGIPAPFYFLSGGQLNVQAPVDLPVNQQTSVAVQVNTAFAVLPNPVGIIAAAPGIASLPDAIHIIAQHADFTLITSASPSKAGESIVTYVSGMGYSTPSYASGQQASLTELAPAKIQPTVTVDGANAAVLYAGLTPGGIGLYQINFTVPASTRSGDATVVITQNGIVANVTKLPVGAP